MKYRQRLYALVHRFKGAWIPLVLVLLLLLTSFFSNWPLAFRQSYPQSNIAANQQFAIPWPFLMRPYYGDQDIQSRITSYFDHDRPWYDSDDVFVRHDGKRWVNSGASVLNCQPGVNCYDGHNGYDLNMRFEPVLSSAPGTVIRAGWYNPLNHNDAFGLWVAIDHGNSLVTSYGHLSTVMVKIGDKVGAQWPIGTSGTTGSSTGPHMHFGTYFYPSWRATDPFGWQGNYPDPNIVPDYNLWTNEVNDTPTPVLSQDGMGIHKGAVLVDDGTPGWSSTGHWDRARSATDIGGSLHWTSTTDGPATATATWSPQLPADGFYEVGAFVNDNHASSGSAIYTIYSADAGRPGTEVTHVVQLDESHIGTFQSPFGTVNTQPQWISLGIHYFRASESDRVVLSNATGENGLQIAADGIEFAPLMPAYYGFIALGANVPQQMTAKEKTTVQLNLQNTSNFGWQAQGPYAVQVIYHWVDSHQHVAVNSQPLPLTRDLAVNASEEVTIPVQAPDEAGVYTLQWQLVQHTQTFIQEGVPEIDTVIVSNNDAIGLPLAPGNENPPGTGGTPPPNGSPTPGIIIPEPVATPTTTHAS